MEVVFWLPGAYEPIMKNAFFFQNIKIQKKNSSVHPTIYVRTQMFGKKEHFMCLL